MLNVKTSQASRPRTIVHPGAFNPVRIQSKNSVAARHVRLSLAPGQSLFDGLVRPLAEMNIHSASTTILGGYLDNLEYCIVQPDPAGKVVGIYTPPVLAGRSYIIFGNATLGKNQAGEPVVHCHAAIRGQDGLTRGGHLLTKACIVGPEPISVFVTSLDGIELRVAFDAETSMPLLQPFKENNDE